MAFDFQDQLKVGRKGELLLLKKWPHPVRKHAELKGPDFLDSEGRVIELKTDTYDMNKTSNFFMERWSDGKLKKPGGVWQAQEKGVTCFVYLFIQQKVWFVFEDVPALVKRLDSLTAKMYIHNIPNKGWTTQGYKVPRDSLKDLYRQEAL